MNSSYQRIPFLIRKSNTSPAYMTVWLVWLWDPSRFLPIEAEPHIGEWRRWLEGVVREGGTPLTQTFGVEMSYRPPGSGLFVVGTNTVLEYKLGKTGSSDCLCRLVFFMCRSPFTTTTDVDFSYLFFTSFFIFYLFFTLLLLG